MDAKVLFQTVSKKMRSDFEAAAQIAHFGSRGTRRENILREFLADGRLPPKYGLGAGEIVGRVKQTSRQSDLIIYDKIDGVTLLYDAQTQVYPIDCVYGIVEVKSALSKAEFIDSLDKIAAFKAMSPGGSLAQQVGGQFTLHTPRPKPFGVVFAFSLAGNSLDSLTKNLRPWEADHDPSLWPNYVCVLEEGIIRHHGPDIFAQPITSEDIKPGSWPMSLKFGEESLFKFYCALHDLCAAMRLGPVELLRYYDPATQIGRFVASGRIDFNRMTDGKAVRPTEAALEKIVAWCAPRGKTDYGEVLMKQLGALPTGMEGHSRLKHQVYFYNPDDLPGLHELGPNPFQRTPEGGVQAERPSLLSLVDIVIDSATYMVPLASLAEDDFEVVD